MIDYRKLWKGIKLLAFGVVLFYVLGIVYILFGFNTKTTEDISYYRALSGETDEPDTMPLLSEAVDVPCPYDLPLLSELEPCLGYRFNYTAKRESLFQSHAYILVVCYDAEAYALRKAAAEEMYTYLENIDSDTPGEYRMSGFTIRAVEGGSYPHEMFFVATSDTRQEIAYIYFDDQDLNAIDRPLGKFLAEETGWNEVIGS